MTTVYISEFDKMAVKCDDGTEVKVSRGLGCYAYSAEYLVLRGETVEQVAAALEGAAAAIREAADDRGGEVSLRRSVDALRDDIYALHELVYLIRAEMGDDS